MKRLEKSGVQVDNPTASLEGTSSVLLSQVKQIMLKQVYMDIHYAIIQRFVLNAADKASLNNRNLYLRRRLRYLIRYSSFELL